MKRNAEIAIALLEIIHIMILMPSIYPVFYLILVERDDSFLLPLFAAGLVIGIPAAASRIILRYVDRFIPCAVLYAAAAAVTMGASYLISMGSRWPVAAAAGYRAAVAVQTVLIGITGVLVRLRENSRKRAKAALDLTWREHRYAFEKPAYHTLAWFVLMYLISLTSDCSTGCDIAVVCFALYAGVTCMHSHLEMTERYIGRLDYVKELPAGRLRTISGAYVVTFLIIAGGAALIPSFLTAGYRMYTDIRDLSFTPDFGWAEYTDYGAAEESERAAEIWRGFAEGGMREPSPLADSAVRFAGFMMAFAAGLFMLREFWRFLGDFRNAGEENGDISVSLEDAGRSGRAARGVGRLRGRREPRDENGRIRRKYMREIMKRRKSIPEPHETPSEIESGTDLAGTREGRELHEEYERARYGVE
ncbi:MAG: hypothetical protein Q4G47_01185 [Lachnospiraceae bacterium]|nr:hypothetical protein [Lachnospiraceae bacterium]